jgi:glutamate synthase (NADPH/NADH) large chain
MFLVDIEAGRIIEDDEIKDSLADSAPYGHWLQAGMMKLSDLPSREHIV